MLKSFLNFLFLALLISFAFTVYIFFQAHQELSNLHHHIPQGDTQSLDLLKWKNQFQTGHLLTNDLNQAKNEQLPWSLIDRLWMKSWDYFMVVTRNTNVIDGVLVNLGYACKVQLRLFDYKHNNVKKYSRQIPLIYCPPTDKHPLQATEYVYSEQNFHVNFILSDNSTHILRNYFFQVQQPQINQTMKANFTIIRPIAYQSLVTVSHLGKSKHLYNVKEFNVPAEGYLQVSHQNHDTINTLSQVMAIQSSITVLDHSRGNMPYFSYWHLICVSGFNSIGKEAHYLPADPLSINIGIIGNQTSHENVIKLGNRTYKIEDILYRIDQNDFLHTQTKIILKEPRGELTFIPKYDVSQQVDMAVVYHKLLKTFGTMEGWLELQGQTHHFDRLYGFAQVAKSRW